MARYASAVLDTAKKYIGYHEKSVNSNLDNFTANSGSNNYNKFAYYIDTNYPNFYNGKKNGYAWCDIFVDYCFISTFGLDAALELLCQPLKSAGAGCTYSYMYYNQKGQTGKVPKIGAQIFFGSSANSLTHTGIVENFDDTYVYTIEGNTSDQVARRTYRRNYSNIYGYGYPKYDDEPTNSTVENPADEGKVVDNYHSDKEVIPEKLNWGTYNKTSKFNKTCVFYGKVTASALNVRSWAGTNNPRIRSIPLIYNGKVIEVLDWIKDNKSDVWYYIRINGSIHGFVHSAYIKKVG